MTLDADTDPERPLDAGGFSTWLDELLGALDGRNDTDVPCGSCTACCTASQFVHIGPDERDTLEHIPPALLFPAPRMPAGHVLMGYDRHGRCPMLVDGLCSIYQHRPRTCRTYDCRVLPAAGLQIDADDEAKDGIAERARRWEFSHPNADDRRRHDAVRRAAAFLDEHRRELPAGVVPTAATPLAVAAIEIVDLFEDLDAATPVEVAAVAVRLRR